MKNFSPNLTKLVIFAGGRGTRLSELTVSTPKPVIDVNGRPLVTFLCEWAFNSGIKTVIIAAGYKQEVLKRRILDHFQFANDLVIEACDVRHLSTYLPEGCRIIIRNTGEGADTAERLYAVRDLLLGDEQFVATYGDTLTDLNLKSLLASAIKNDTTITMCIGRPDGRYGEVVFTDGRVEAFSEKKRPDFYVNRGFFVIKESIFERWKSSYRSLERDVLPDLVVRGDLGAHRDDCWFHSVDSARDLVDLEQYLACKNGNLIRA